MKRTAGRTVKLGALASLVAAVLVVASAASAGSFSAASGDLRATLSYSGTYPQAHATTLTLTRSGKVVDVVSVTSKWCGGSCWPSSATSKTSPVEFVRLQPKGPVEIVLSLYSGGAHCCTIEQVDTLHQHRLTTSQYDFGDPGALLEPIGKGASDVFVSEDARFAYTFTDYAASGMPLRVMSYKNGAFHDVTTRYPQRLARDAALWRRTFFSQASSHYEDTTGLAAAWAADEDLLGHRARVQRFLSIEARAGHLNSALGNFEPHGEGFVVALDKFLAKTGYTS